MKRKKDEKKKGLFKNKLAKGILAGVLGFTLIGTVVGVTENQYHWISNNVSKNDNEDDSPMDSSIKEENGISIIGIQKKAASDSLYKYGEETVNYKFGEDVTDRVLYKINYTGQSEVPDSSILTISHEVGSMKIGCNKPFLKQITITLYAESDEKINASITLDFVEKLTLTYSYPFITTVGQDLKTASVLVETTGGSIEVDKEVRDQFYSYDYLTLATYYQRPILEENMHLIVRNKLGKKESDSEAYAKYSIKNATSNGVKKVGWRGKKNPETGEYEYSVSFRLKYIDDGPFNPTTMLKNICYAYEVEGQKVEISMLDLMQYSSELKNQVVSFITEEKLFKMGFTVNGKYREVKSRILDANLILNNITSIEPEKTAISF